HTPRSKDLDQPGCVFLAALAGEQLYMADSQTAWQPFRAGQPIAFRTGKLAAMQTEIISRSNVGGLTGISLYAGYGRGSDAASCWADMLQSKSYRQMYTF
ncbi:hypothetical protein, partial [Chitinimonas sp.]|uniref:hypothetical protein n=1 Tax=Chitinimonas sp. TaxID=1934313 RepID=UPI0035AF5D7F